MVGFFDVYNVFNTNAEQVINTTLWHIVAAADCDYAAAHRAGRNQGRVVGEPDLVILSEDIAAIPAARLADVHVDATWWTG